MFTLDSSPVSIDHLLQLSFQSAHSILVFKGDLCSVLSPSNLDILLMISTVIWYVISRMLISRIPAQNPLSSYIEIEYTAIVLFCFICLFCCCCCLLACLTQALAVLYLIWSGFATCPASYPVIFFFFLFYIMVQQHQTTLGSWKFPTLVFLHVFTQNASFFLECLSYHLLLGMIVFCVILNSDASSSMKFPQISSINLSSISFHKLSLCILHIMFGIIVIMLFYNCLFSYLFL